MAVIFVVDDEEKISKLLKAQLDDAGHTAYGMTRPSEALEKLSRISPDIVVTDLRMDEMDGITLLKEVKKASPETDVVVMTAYATVETALDTMKHGAYDYIIKPFTTDELLMLIERIEKKRRLETENSELRSYLAAGMEDEIIGESEAIGGVKKLIGDVAQSDAPVLIAERAAPARSWSPGPFTRLHRGRRAPLSPSTARPYPPASLRVNCSATRRARLPAPPAASWVTSRWPTAAPSFSMRSAICR